jgi:hypothetical protein
MQTSASRQHQQQQGISTSSSSSTVPSASVFLGTWTARLVSGWWITVY